MLRKLVWVFLEKGGITIIQFVTIVVLGRILTPEIYGIYGIMMIYISISDMLIDSGMGGALVYKKEISTTDVSTLFFTNFFISLFLYAIIFFSSPFIESFYKVPELSTYLRILGITIIFYSFSQVQNAIMVRSFQFRKSSLIYLTAVTISSIMSICMAFSGMGIWALICQSLITSFLVSLLLWSTSAVKIDFCFSVDSLKFFWSFGSKLLGANLLKTIVDNINTTIVPKIGNLVESGLFFQSSRFVSVPNTVLRQTIDKFSFPILSKIDDKFSFFDMVKKINKGFYVFFIPVFPLLAYVAKPLIILVLGPKWSGCILYFSIIVWSGIFLLSQVLSRNTLKSLGLTSQILYVEMLNSFACLIVLFFCSFIGTVALAYGIVVLSFLGALFYAFSLKTQYSLYSQCIDVGKFLMPSILIYYFISNLSIPSSNFRFLIAFFVYVFNVIINLSIDNTIRQFLYQRVRFYCKKQ